LFPLDEASQNRLKFTVGKREIISHELWFNYYITAVSSLNLALFTHYYYLLHISCAFMFDERVFAFQRMNKLPDPDERTSFEPVVFYALKIFQKCSYYSRFVQKILKQSFFWKWEEWDRNRWKLHATLYRFLRGVLKHFLLKTERFNPNYFLIIYFLN
jgi:hypothetical protein